MQSCHLPNWSDLVQYQLEHSQSFATYLLDNAARPRLGYLSDPPKFARSPSPLPNCTAKLFEDFVLTIPSDHSDMTSVASPPMEGKVHINH